MLRVGLGDVVDILMAQHGWSRLEAAVSGYSDQGRYQRKLIESFLPADWTWKGKRVLDFGCGSGKVMRQFADVAHEAEIWGCDIDAPSIEWVQGNLCPPFHAFACDEEPGLAPIESGYFDLIFAFSVYTHITDHSAGWLLEHHRALRDGGYLLATFLGEATIGPLKGEQWSDDGIGFNPLLAGYPWERGGPIVFISPWWLKAHWGRAFEIEQLRPYERDDPPSGHGLVLAKRKPVQLTTEDLERLEPNEPREITALQHHVRQLRDETLDLRRAHDLAAAGLAAAQAREADLKEQLRRAQTPDPLPQAVRRRARMAGRRAVETARSRGWAPPGRRSPPGA